MDRTVKNLKNLEIHEIKTSKGNARLILDVNTLEVEMIVDHKILAKCKQIDFQPIVKVEGFYND